MPLVEKGEFEDTPHIPEDYYIAEIARIQTYERDNSDSSGLVINFKIVDNDFSWIVDAD